MSAWEFILPEGTELLTKDETALWQGRPGTAGFARRLLHVRVIAGYFLVLAAWNIISLHADGGSNIEALCAALWLLVPTVAAIAVILAVAYVLAATSHYMITNKRIIMQIGVAFPIAVTVPLSKIGSADLKLYPDGSGDISVSFNTRDQIAYLLLWPHARPNRFKRAEPMMRAVANARDVAATLAKALAAASTQPSVTSVPAGAGNDGAVRPEPGRGMAVA